MRSQTLTEDGEQAIVGLAGAHRNGCIAISADSAFRAICEVERLTRVRRQPLPRAGVPAPVQELLACPDAASATYVVAEDDFELPPSGIRLEHHFAHAASAFFSSPFERSAILVSDSRDEDGTSVWLGEGVAIHRVSPSRGPKFASIYSACARTFGFVGPDPARRLEALACMGAAEPDESVPVLWDFADGNIRLRTRWTERLAGHLQSIEGSFPRRAAAAAAIQHRLAALLRQWLCEVRLATGTADICLGGGLFFNTFINTSISTSGLFERTFVPINPGNPGLSAGCVMAVAARAGRRPLPPSPFLGPGYEPEVVKAVLDNCKLTYSLETRNQLLDAVTSLLRRGAMVGWFEGGMEWGHRALGHRSIVADPLLPHVLDNLNLFLKKRERHSTYAVSVLLEDLDRHFIGPPESPSMEYEYRPKDPDLFRSFLPDGVETIRVQTIDNTPSLFRDLHRAYRELTGVGVLVNTSFNGFHEPIVCSPRDAVRVFYGSGLDALVIGRFLIRK